MHVQVRVPETKGTDGELRTWRATFFSVVFFSSAGLNEIFRPAGVGAAAGAEFGRPAFFPRRPLPSEATDLLCSWLPTFFTCFLT
jgi:hypothetical protein